MPFFLRSDEELIAEATRALEELGVQIVVDDRSRSLEESWQPLQPVGKILHRMLEGDVAMHPLVAVHTVRDALEEWCHQGAYAELYTSLLVASVPNGEGGLSQHSYSLLRNRGGVVDVRASVRAWWREVQAQETSSGVFTCRQCQRRGDQAGGAALSCRACWAAFCVSCAQRMVQSNAPCPACASCCTRIDESPPIWGVPWDMPRPTPSPPQAAAPPSSSALPRRMAAAVGPDGWLRPPPQHQRMHPVDVLVDGVLAALDGYVMVNPMSGSVEDQRYIVRFERLPLREDFSPDHATLEQARQYLKRVLPSVARQAARCVRHEVDVRVVRLVARAHPVTGKPIHEESYFIIRKRERAASSGGGGGGGGGGSSMGRRSGGGSRGGGAAAVTPEPCIWERDWELVQMAPGQWYPSDNDVPTERADVAYLEPVRFELPGGVRRVLRDAHARLGGTACGAKQVIFLRTDAAHHPRPFNQASLDRSGQLSGATLGALSRVTQAVLREARMAGVPLFAYCRDVEAAQRTGQDGRGLNVMQLESKLVTLEGLAWQQRRQQRPRRPRGTVREAGAALPWEERGRAGRRGRRQRVPSVVFELGPAGERGRALPPGEAAWVVVHALALHS